MHSRKIQIFLFLVLCISSRTPVLAGTHDQYLDAAYPNGDAYFLIGDVSDIDGSFVNNVVTEFTEMSGRLNALGFRTISNPVATVADLAEALANPRTTVLIWASHGAKDGTLADRNNVEIPESLFSSDSPIPRFVYLAACHGDSVGKKYDKLSNKNQVILALPGDSTWPVTAIAGSLRNRGFMKELRGVLGPFKPRCQDFLLPKDDRSRDLSNS